MFSNLWTYKNVTFVKKETNKGDIPSQLLSASVSCMEFIQDLSSAQNSEFSGNYLLIHVK
jgi:hypothetical protein